MVEELQKLLLSGVLTFWHILLSDLSGELRNILYLLNPEKKRLKILYVHCMSEENLK